MRLLIIALLATVGWALFQDSSPSPIVTGQLLLGAGGHLSGIDIKCDSTCGNGTGTSTMVTRADTYGFYYFNPSATPCGNTPLKGCWQQLISSSSINNSSYQQLWGQAIFPGIEIRVAPSNTQHFYAIYCPNDGGGSISCELWLSSTNRGTNWTLTANPFGSNYHFFSFGGTYNGPFLAIDPANENVVFAATPSAGIYYTSNAGSTFASVTGISAGNGTDDLVVFDQTSTVTGGKTTGAYACRQGTGIYHTTNANSGASSTWTETTTTNMPTTCQHMVVDLNGNLWVTDQSQSTTLYKFNGTSWSQTTAPLGLFSVTVDPYNANVVYGLHPGGAIVMSLDGGTTFTKLLNSSQAASTLVGCCGGRVATDVPWLAAATEDYMTASDIIVDPAQTQWTTSTTSATVASSGTITFTTVASNFGNYPVGTVVTVYETATPANVMQGTIASGSSGTTVKITMNDSAGSGTHTDWTLGTTVLYFAQGIGVWWSNPTITSNKLFVWNSQSAGIEQLEPSSVVSPWGSAACSALGTSTSVPLVTVFDRGIFTISNQLQYPLKQFENSASGADAAILPGMGVDWAGQSPQHLFGLVTEGGANSGKGFYVSSDCGNSWTAVTTPADVWQGSRNCCTFPSAAIAAVTTNNVIVGQFQVGNYYTTDGGTTWHTMTVASNPTSGYVVAGSGSSGNTINVSSSLDNGSGVPTWLSGQAGGGTTFNVVDNNTGNSVDTTLSSTTSTSATFASLSGLGTVTTGDLILIRVRNADHGAAADRVNDETFYECVLGAGAAGEGCYKTTNGGATWASTCTASSSCPVGLSFGGQGAGYLTVPGNAGHLFMIGGIQAGGASPSATFMGIWHSTDGAATWSEIKTAGNSIESVACLGFGAAMPGSDGYPTVYFYGWVNQGSGYAAGLWRIVNADGVSPTFTNVSVNQWAQGSLDVPASCTGDGNVSGRSYLGMFNGGVLRFQVN